jgi:hypothetical protein
MADNQNPFDLKLAPGQLRAPDLPGAKTSPVSNVQPVNASAKPKRVSTRQLDVRGLNYMRPVTRFNNPVEKAVVDRLSSLLGIADIETRHVGPSNVKTWSENPAGMSFQSVNTSTLLKEMSSNRNFVETTDHRDKKAGQRRFREVGANGSLHVTLSTQATGDAEIHIDSVAIVKGRTPDGGPIFYGWPTLDKHSVKDWYFKKLHLENDEWIRSPMDNERGTDF